MDHSSQDLSEVNGSGINSGRSRDDDIEPLEMSRSEAERFLTSLRKTSERVQELGNKLDMVTRKLEETKVVQQQANFQTLDPVCRWFA